MMGSVRVADNDRGGTLEGAADYVENGVRRATDDTACERRRIGNNHHTNQIVGFGVFLMSPAVIPHLLLLYSVVR